MKKGKHRKWYTPDELARIYIDHEEGVSYKELAEKYNRKRGALYQSVSDMRKAMDGEPRHSRYRIAANKVRNFYEFQADADINWSPEHQEVKELGEDTAKVKFTPSAEVTPGELTRKAEDNINDFLDVVKQSITNLSIDLGTAVALDTVKKMTDVVAQRDERIKELEKEVQDLRTIRDTAKKVNLSEVLYQRLSGVLQHE